MIDSVVLLPPLHSQLIARTKGNHTGYKQVKGTKASAEEIRDIYEGLKQNYLTDFDMMLSGYAPGADAVNVVGAIGRDLKLKSSTKSGSFFWGSAVYWVRLKCLN